MRSAWSNWELNQIWKSPTKEAWMWLFAIESAQNLPDSNQIRSNWIAVASLPVWEFTVLSVSVLSSFLFAKKSRRTHRKHGSCTKIPIWMGNNNHIFLFSISPVNDHKIMMKHGPHAQRGTVVISIWIENNNSILLFSSSPVNYHQTVLGPMARTYMML